MQNESQFRLGRKLRADVQYFLTQKFSDVIKWSRQRPLYRLNYRQIACTYTKQECDFKSDFTELDQVEWNPIPKVYWTRITVQLKSHRSTLLSLTIESQWEDVVSVLKYFSSFVAVKFAKKSEVNHMLTKIVLTFFCQFYGNERWTVL